MTDHLETTASTDMEAWSHGEAVEDSDVHPMQVSFEGPPDSLWEKRIKFKLSMFSRKTGKYELVE